MVEVDVIDGAHHLAARRRQAIRVRDSRAGDIMRRPKRFETPRSSMIGASLMPT